MKRRNFFRLAASALLMAVGIKSASAARVLTDSEYDAVLECLARAKYGPHANTDVMVRDIVIEEIDGGHSVSSTGPLVPKWKVNIGLTEEELKAVLDHLQIEYRGQITPYSSN